MNRGRRLIFLGAALATGLVGLVTLPAAPMGHYLPALWKIQKTSSDQGVVLVILIREVLQAGEKLF